MTLTFDPLYIALVAVALAGLVHGTLGVGFPLVSTPLIALGTDVKTAILLTLAPTLVVNTLSIWRGGGWRDSIGRFWWVALLVLIGSVIGTQILIVSDPAPFKLMLAIVIIVYLLTSRDQQQNHWAWIRHHPRFSGTICGISGGLLAGTVNVALPPLIIFLTEMQLAPVVLVQSINLCFMAGKAAQIGTFAVAGQLDQKILLLSIPLAVIAAASLRFGMRIRDRVDTETYRGWLRKILVLLAVILILQFLFA